MTLNQRAMSLADELVTNADLLRVTAETVDGGGRLIDCGIGADGGLEAGCRLAEICMAGLGEVRLVPAAGSPATGMAVAVSTDQPVRACMAAQYAGWQISQGDFFAMGSGPMRAAYGGEALFDDIGHKESASVAVGVLETRQPPGAAVFSRLAESCSVAVANLTLLVAPTASLAGTIQVVARSVETSLHKLHELGFDLTRIVSGCGSAPLPPVAKDDLQGIGVTNDAVLYGGDVTLFVRGDDDSLQEVGPRIPSAASDDYGKPFIELFQQYNHDFYKIDPMLFSPAVVRMQNVETGRTFAFGERNGELLRQSFGV